MLTEEDFEYAIDKKLIDSETKELIEEYNERLIDNNVPIIYNLRHLRKILDIKKREQELFWGKIDRIHIKHLKYQRRAADLEK